MKYEICIGSKTVVGESMTHMLLYILKQKTLMCGLFFLNGNLSIQV